MSNRIKNPLFFGISRFVSCYFQCFKAMIISKGGIQDESKEKLFQDGKRKRENMNDETKDTLKKVAEYTAEEKKKLKKKMADMMIGAVVLLVFCYVLFESNGFGGIFPERSCRNIISFTFGISSATLVLNIMYLFGVLDKIRAKKMFLKRKE